LTCLNRHLADKHRDDASASESTEARARLYLGDVNRRLVGSRQRYQGHRQQVMALALGAAPAAAAPAGDIVIFGAGNGSDLDLPLLAGTFREIHLVDLDGEALERARQELPPALRTRVVPHAPVDLSGFMSYLDDWGESLPDDATLNQTAFSAARAIVAALGRDFDVVLSTGALSQLIVPFHRAWLTTRTNWERLDAAIVAVHLATLVLSACPGGRGAMAFDVLSSNDAPALLALAGRGGAALEAAIDARLLPGSDRLHPQPMTLLGQLQFPGMASMVRQAQLTSPWLWNLGEALQLVYGLQFRRP
jgi:hypothetical protein